MRTRVEAVTITALAAQAGVVGKGVLAAASSLPGLGKVAVIVAGIVVLLAVATMAGGRWAGRVRLGVRHADAPTTGGPDVADLATEASSALRQADDAVLTSEQELGFATAVFGERAMGPFSAALDSARGERREAFRLWQVIDDDPAARSGAPLLLAEIVERCAAVSRLLDDQAEEFDQAHNVGARAQQLVAEVDAHIAQQCERMSQSREVLGRLGTKYTPSAIITVASNPDYAGTRLQFAADCLASAEAAAAAGAAGKAAVLLQAAEAGADQATDLLTGVLHMEAELTQAASAVPAALREIEAEIAEATAHLRDRPDEERAALVAAARAVSDDVRAKLAAGAFDALVALRDLQQADAALDCALAGVRTQQARRQRAIAVLDEAMLVARSSVTAAEDFITTRRGGVGTTARSELAEAWRHFQQAIGVGQADPEAALGEAQNADALAQRARAVAEQDVATFNDGELSTENVAAWSGWTGGACAGLRGAILGGILIEGQDGGIGPGSFGGIGTRGRHAVRRGAPGRAGQTTIAEQTGAAERTGAADQSGVADQTSISGSV